jgi:hypothetical protein
MNASLSFAACGLADADVAVPVAPLAGPVILFPQDITSDYKADGFQRVF